MSGPTRCFVCGNRLEFCRCAHQAPQTVAEKGGKSCLGCQYGAQIDTGYSNYTVEGTDFYCMKGLHPDAPFDGFYGVDSRLALADTCRGYVEGESVEIDVEGELLDELPGWVQAWYGSDFS